MTTADGFDLDPASLTYDDRGLLPVVAQDEASGAVLMLAYADREAVELTLSTRQAHFWSRSRRELWRKGATSGNTLEVREVLTDCDRDALLLRVRPAGPACHRGTRSCFEPNAARLELGWLWRVLEARKNSSARLRRDNAGGDVAPEARQRNTSYTAQLLAEGLPRVAQKVGEEAVETVIAALAVGPKGEGTGDREALVEEGSDLLYHLLVLLLAAGVEPGRLAAELHQRHTASSERAPGATKRGDE